MARYDALTKSNEVYYQNGLSLSNLPFSEACGSLLTNYCWKKFQAMESKLVAKDAGLDPENVFFGIDVWAQNRTGPTHSRTTYGNGGTTTGVAVTKLADFGLSAGIFAPAWSYEHFPGRGKEVERAMWEGDALPDDLTCSCGDVSRHCPKEGFSVTERARAYPVGSDTFFYTNFARAFAKHTEDERQTIFGGHELHAQLATQSIHPLPLPWRDRYQESRLKHRLQDTAGQTTLVIDVHNGLTTENRENRYFNRWLPLFKLDMPANGTLRVEVAGRKLVPHRGALPSLYLKFSSLSGPDKEAQLLTIARTEDVYVASKIIGTPGSDVGEYRLTELGFHLYGYAGDGVIPVAEILSISIKPILDPSLSKTYEITNIHIERRGEGENRHMRLCWSYTSDAEAQQHMIQHSSITGPFSHFIIKLNNLSIGIAHALEYLLDKSILTDLIKSNAPIAIQLTGIGFDGRALASQTASLPIDAA